MTARALKICGFLVLLPVWQLANPPPPASTTPAPTVPTTPAPVTLEPPALVALRSAHQLALKARQETVLKKQIETLRAMEIARAAQGDYLGAEQAAAALAGLEKSINIVLQKGPSLLLDSRLPHSVSFGATTKQGVFQLNKTNATVRWDGVALPAGRYQVKLTYLVDAPVKTSDEDDPPAFGGTVTFGEVTSINGSGVLKFRVARTTEPVEKTTVDLGFIATTTSRPTFALKATEALPAGALTLLAVELVLVPSELVPEVLNLEAKEFAVAEEEYRKQMQEKISGATKFWLTKLQELSKSATASANQEALDLINPELLRVSLLLNPAAAVVAGSGGKILLPAFDPIIATFNSEIRLSNTKDCLQRLRPAGARVSFNLAAAKVQSGRYQVTLNINAGAGMGGAFLLTCGDSKIRGDIERESSPVRRSVTLSKTLVISSDAKYLELSVESLALTTGSLCELRSIHLTPEK